MATYAQGRYLIKLQKLRSVTLDDVWPLQERFRLHTAYSEFKYNTEESYFILRSIFRMMWRPMIPVYLVGLLLQIVPLLQIRLNSSIMQSVDDLSNYTMYMVLADIMRIMIIQLLDNQQNIAHHEVEMTQGTGRLVGKIAYLEQQPWIMNDTLRANILFGRQYDEEYYWKVLSACALTDDLEMWPSGDLTVIGENGMNISGGQRARLALARTVYSRADIYFLDDPLSAVDAIVKRHILDNIILSTGMLGNKLRFVTTNADNILPLCNQIVTMDNSGVSVKVQTPQIHTAFKANVMPAAKAKEIGDNNKQLFRSLAEREAEAPYVVEGCRPSAQWPPNGKIEFRDFSMKYGVDLGYALRNINLTINPGEKIGIVGRTGAGKSSLAKVLFRLIPENTSGSILIDGQDISEFGIGDYRPRLGMIPQESSMFSGSIRRNLDPLNQFDIENMWASLIKCNVAKTISTR
ncbi:hypothetical protein GGI20_005677, partial [Coemansia sp. BCRC 34301]